MDRASDVSVPQDVSGAFGRAAAASAARGEAGRTLTFRVRA
jgi:hypothetical protein